MRKRAFPFLVLLLCACIQGGVLGIVSNCRGLFYSPVCQELGVELGAFTTYSTFYGLAVCASIPLATRGVRKWNLRFTLGMAGALVAIMQYAMSWFTALWQWYLAATIQGVCHAFLVVQAIPMLVGNWFAARKGFFLGVACASSGIVGAVMNTITAQYMVLYDWRASYRFLGMVLFLFLVPTSLLLAVRTPEEMGTQPYGQGKTDAQSPKQAVFRGFQRKQAYPLLIAYTCLICMTVGFNQLLSALGHSFGYPGEIVGGFISWAMIGTVVWKLVAGWCNDHFGVAATSYLSGGVIILGLGLLIFGRHSLLMYLGSFCMGMPLAISVVVVPNMVRGIFGNEQFEERYKLVSMLVNLSTNVSFTLIGWLVSLSGSYTVTLETGIGVTFLSLLLVTIFFRMRERSCPP